MPEESLIVGNTSIFFAYHHAEGSDLGDGLDEILIFDVWVYRPFEQCSAMYCPKCP